MIRTALLALALTAAAPPARAAEPALPAGVDATGLTAPQREVLARVLDRTPCYCGCPHTVAACMRGHSTCKHAPRAAQLALRVAATGAPAPDVERFLSDYYASFDRKHRATFNVKDFGPPLGPPEAPITVVEYSDFTCPYCRMLRPVLERWVKKNDGRVRLFYKPFPLANHPRAMEMAEAAEFAREKGKFWPMHDHLFEAGRPLSDDDLAGLAQRVGLSGDELRAALGSKRFRPRIFAAQAEARAARLEGTPTLYVNGRKHLLMLGSRGDPMGAVEWGLDFTLQDEEEWSKGGGWARD
jgi:predicted DsbA family dithiol-disulfide isomerase